jgi:glycosyltransferase involved in cell wall biosynthesis
VIEEVLMLDEKLQNINSPLSSLSICVTSYNKSLHLNQTLQQLEELRNLGAELVIIDDGSTDDSTRLLSEYALDRNGVKLHLQSNHGSANARNRAIQLSTGQILFFLDIDDSINIDILIKNVVRMNEHKLNLVMMNYLFLHENTVGSYFNDSNQLLKLDFNTNRSKLLETMGYWRILYSQDYIKKYELKFSPSFSDLGDRKFIYDDFFWLLHLYSHESEITIAPNHEVVYFYNNLANQTLKAWQNYGHQAALMPLAIKQFFKELIICQHFHDFNWIAVTCVNSLYFHYANFTLSNLPRALLSLFKILFDSELSGKLGVDMKAKFKLALFLIHKTSRNSVALMVNRFPSWARLDRGIRKRHKLSKDK